MKVLPAMEQSRNTYVLMFKGGTESILFPNRERRGVANEVQLTEHDSSVEPCPRLSQ